MQRCFTPNPMKPGMDLTKVAWVLALAVSSALAPSAAEAETEPITISLGGVEVGLNVSRFVIIVDDIGSVTGTYDDGDLLVLSDRLTHFEDFARALVHQAGISALAVALNEAPLDGSIRLLGSRLTFGTFDTLGTDSAGDAGATARTINGNSLATTVLGAIINTDLTQTVADSVDTQFAAQYDSSLAIPLKLHGLAATPSNDVVSALGSASLVSAAVNTGELNGSIALAATAPAPWFLAAQDQPAIDVSNLDAASTVIGAMNSITAAANAVTRNVTLHTAVQIVGGGAR